MLAGLTSGEASWQWRFESLVVTAFSFRGAQSGEVRAFARASFEITSNCSWAALHKNAGGE
jgi:hypothetical protein